MFARALRRLKRSWNERLFDREAKTILRTWPLALQNNSPLFLSMIRHRDVTAYLLAIKFVYTGAHAAALYRDVPVQ